MNLQWERLDDITTSASVVQPDINTQQNMFSTSMQTKVTDLCTTTQTKTENSPTSTTQTKTENSPTSTTQTKTENSPAFSIKTKTKLENRLDALTKPETDTDRISAICVTAENNGTVIPAHCARHVKEDKILHSNMDQDIGNQEKMTDLLPDVS